MRTLLFLAGIVAWGQEVVWEAKPGFRDFGGMAVGNGVVLTGNITGKGGTFGFDAATGKLLWRSPGHQVRNHPAIDGRAGFTVNQVSGETFRLSAFDLKSGKVLWSAEGRKLSSNADLLAEGGRVYLISDDGKARAYEAATGKVVWEHAFSPEDGRCPSSPALGDGVLYFGGGEQNYSKSQGVFLWALDASTGKELWRFAAKPEISSRVGDCVTAPAVSAGVVAVASDRFMYALDAKTGAMKWRKEVRKVVDGQDRGRTLSAPVIGDGRVYAMFEEGIIGWGLENGRVEFEFEGNFAASQNDPRLVHKDGLLYFAANFEQPKTEGNRQGFLYALDPATKQVKWKHRTNRPSRFESEAKWPTHYFLPAGEHVYYETNLLLVKLKP